MLHEARYRAAEPESRGSSRHYRPSAREEMWKRQVTQARQTGGLQRDKTDGRLQVTVTVKQTGGLDTREAEKCWGSLSLSRRERDSHILTSALSIPATIFIVLLAPLLHTKSMGLVSASHTSEATTQSSRSPADKHTH